MHGQPIIKTFNSVTNFDSSDELHNILYISLIQIIKIL